MKDTSALDVGEPTGVILAPIDSKKIRRFFSKSPDFLNVHIQLTIAIIL